MYTLSLLFLSTVVRAWRRQEWLLGALLLGIGLANRSDLILAAPALGYLVWSGRPGGRHAVAMAIAIGVGMLLYLYLPIRAGARPWLNWNDPSSLDHFVGSLVRRGYGGTLDTLSSSYHRGENFLAQWILYMLS